MNRVRRCSPYKAATLESLYDVRSVTAMFTITDLAESARDRLAIARLKERVFVRLNAVRCPEHKQAPEGEIEVQLPGKVILRLTYCCDRLRAAVHAALQHQRK